MSRLVVFCAIVGLTAGLHHLGTYLKQSLHGDEAHEFIHKHSFKSATNSCANYQPELKDASDKMKECIHSKFDPDRKSLCHFIHNDFWSCTDAPRSLLRKCLPQKSKSIPDLLVEMILSGFDEVCSAKGSELLELTQPCITHSISEDNDNECKDLLQIQLLKYANEAPTKSEFCGLFHIYRSCLERHLESHCSSSITRRNFFKFYDAFGKPCKNIHVI